MSIFQSWNKPRRFSYLINISRGWAIIKRIFGRGRNKFGDRIIIEDEVEVWHGNVHFKSKGHIVSLGLKGLIAVIGAVAGTTQGFSTTFNTYAGSSRIRVGTNTTTPTTEATSDLVSPVATDRNSASVTLSNPATGQYRITWSSTWNAGALGAITIGEIGLYLRFSIIPSLPQTNYTPSTPTDAQFFSRLSSGDGDFTAFAVNTSNPLSIEWKLTFAFS